MPYRPDKIKKMQRLGAALLTAIRDFDQIQIFESQIVEFCSNLMKCCDATLVRIAVEIEIELRANQILTEGPSDLLDSIEE